MDLALSSFCCLLKLTVTSKLGVSLVLNELYNLPNIKNVFHQTAKQQHQHWLFMSKHTSRNLWCTHWKKNLNITHLSQHRGKCVDKWKWETQEECWGFHVEAFMPGDGNEWQRLLALCLRKERRQERWGEIGYNEENRNVCNNWPLTLDQSQYI